MSTRTLYRLATAMLIALFLSMQIGSASHELHLDEEHEHHECVTCHLAIEDIEFEVVLSGNNKLTSIFEITYSEDYEATFIQPSRSIHHCRAPPPRGPPATEI